MAYRVTFRALLRPAHWHRSPCHQHRFIAPSAAQPFSHSAAPRNGAGPDQASWDSIIDEADAFAKADNRDSASSPSSSSSSSSRQTPRTAKRVYATQARRQSLQDSPHRVASTASKSNKKKSKRAEPAPELSR